MGQRVQVRAGARAELRLNQTDRSSTIFDWTHETLAPFSGVHYYFGHNEFRHTSAVDVGPVATKKNGVQAAPIDRRFWRLLARITRPS